LVLRGRGKHESFKDSFCENLPTDEKEEKEALFLKDFFYRGGVPLLFSKGRRLNLPAGMGERRSP